ncbi:4-(cytidine 5'-diphospho)-2-C-methyl-D-erythritol kinase [Camelliibacillus cellulosilyticus]|uniref:4-diphosphocytidyl-2-C-methyl-D-erythritol kinase n=1 Tax=Camelliibacillus cellulosilyticus TaxID=2174486 RepID=A0ABV9GT70_9BACL
MKIIEKAPAKINLALDVLGKRADGYHELKMVMTTVDLADYIECQEVDNDEIIIRSSAPFVPEDARNFAYKAAQVIKKKYGIKNGVAIKINKEIPVAAGLAGGSSDAAAAIRALNRLWALGMTERDMMALGAEIGSDIPFCVRGGTALATGRGEVIEPLPAPPPCWVVLAKPALSVSTADTFHALDLSQIVHPDVDGMVQAVIKQDYDRICHGLGNVLESVTMRRHDEVGRIKDVMARMGADGVLMSGSGPTVFGLTQYESRASRLYNSLKGFCLDVFAVRMLG